MRTRRESPANLIAIIDDKPMFRIGIRKTVQFIAPRCQISDYRSIDDLAAENRPIRFTHFLIRVGNNPYHAVINIIRKLRLSDASCKIILYDYQESINHVILFFAENINAYLQDNFDEDDLRQCFYSVDSNKRYLSNQIAAKLLNIKISPSLKRGSQFTPTEVKVADLLIRGMKTSLIAKEMDRKISTISTIKSNIFRKANVNNIVDLAGIMGKSPAMMKV